MASTSGRFNSGPRDLGKIVRQYFDELLDVDLCKISVLPFTEQFSAEELQMIRAAFLITFSDEELDWAIRKIIRCVGFLTLDILMPALRVCKRMEPSATQEESAVLNCHPVLLVRAAAGCEDVPKGPQTEGAGIDELAHKIGYMESPMPASQSRADFSHLYFKRLSEGRQTQAKEFKFVVAKALEIPTLLLETLTPGYAVWRTGFYAGCQDISEFLEKNRNQTQTKEAFIDLIHITSMLLIDLRKLISRGQSTRAEGSVTQEDNYFQFEDFVIFIMEHFVLEASRNLLERLVNAPSRLRLQYESRVRTQAAEMPFLPQVFVLNRGPVMKKLTTAISKNVTNFLHDAVDMMARKRALLESDTETEAVSVSEYSISESDTSVSTSRLPEENLRSQDCGGHSGTLCPGQGGSVLADRGVTNTLISSSSSSSRNSSCSSITSEMSRSHSTSTCSVKDLPTERPHVSSSSLSTRPEEAVATLAMSSHQDSANVKSLRGEDKQRRKRIFTIHWKSRRSIAPLPVVEKPVAHSPERTRRLSLSSRLASGICRLFCCGKVFLTGFDWGPIGMEQIKMQVSPANSTLDNLPEAIARRWYGPGFVKCCTAREASCGMRIAGLVNEAFLSAVTQRNISSEFKSTGIFPYNQAFFPEEVFAPSLVSDRPNPELNSTGPSTSDDCNLRVGVPFALSGLIFTIMTGVPYIIPYKMSTRLIF